VHRIPFVGLTLGISLAAILCVGLWNAWRFPIALGYDFGANAAYMHAALHDHRLPTKDESAEYRQPPVYYVVGGLAARAGRIVFHWNEAPDNQGPERSFRGAQILNVALVLLTALLVLSLARTLAPGRTVVHASSVAFFAFVPVVAKTAAMFHPEPLNMALSTLAVWLTVKIAGGAPHRRRLFAFLIAVLLLGAGTRASNAFTAIAAAIALLVVLRPKLHALRDHTLPLVAGVVVVTAVGFWLVHGAHFGNLAPGWSVSSTSHAGFFDLPSTSLFTHPYRPFFRNAAIAETYTEIWGDWIGAFAWSTYAGAPRGAALAVLKDQNWIGVVPTMIALAGYLLLCRKAIQRRELLVLALVPPIAIFGYLLRSYEQLSSDGDLFKASYILTTAPIWALAFGLGFDRLGRFRLGGLPYVQIALGVALVFFAGMELRFLLYGVRDGTVIF
jgi:hypothetical protein